MLLILVGRGLVLSVDLVILVVIVSTRLWRTASIGNAALVGALVGLSWLTRGEQVLLLYLKKLEW